MKPERELDALVAEHVMGWKNVVYMPGTFGGCARGLHPDDHLRPPRAQFGIGEMVPRYCEDVAASWKVIETLQAEGNIIDLLWHPDAKAWSVLIGDMNTTAMTAPMAICLAALKDRGILVKP